MARVQAYRKIFEMSRFDHGMVTNVVITNLLGL